MSEIKVGANTTDSMVIKMTINKYYEQFPVPKVK